MSQAGECLPVCDLLREAEDPSVLHGEPFRGRAESQLDGWSVANLRIDWFYADDWFLPASTGEEHDC
jgi:hypothetical protein